MADIVPYSCVIIDCCWRDFFKSAALCVSGTDDRSSIISDLQQQWKTSNDPRPVLPSLSVRSTLDLFLSVKKYPRGSEIIMSAINIPDMVEVVHHHGLIIVTLDVSIETMAPKKECLADLVTDKTVAMLLAHIYGRWFEMEPFIEAGRQHGLDVIEDCAEGFHGFSHLGHPEADISLFSFGVIKYCTSFGGSINKVKDPGLYSQMEELQNSYPVQSHSSYLYKVMKYSILYIFMNRPTFTKAIQQAGTTFGIDVKKHVVNLLRGFPDCLIQKLRHQPSDALLQTMRRRFDEFVPSDVSLGTCKGDYVSDRLPDSATQVGNKAKVRNYWLFPIVVEDPEEVLKCLNAVGVDAYRGATQLSLVEPDNENFHLRHLQSFVVHYPHEARFLMDHVIYLPVSKLVPFQELDKICEAFDAVLKTHSKNLLSLPKYTREDKLQSKL